ncbi:MAG: hypothetical protein HY842_10345 [Bacteroidetes bacterium]|nr:hypothetical protein [Bacteroidota bacterium]
MKTATLIFFFFFGFAAPVLSQHFSFGFQVIGLSCHLKKSNNRQLFKGKITHNGRVVVNGGVLLTARYHVDSRWGVQVSQALVARDCSGRFLGMSHVGVFGKMNDLRDSPNSVDVSFGPMFFYRQNWALLPGYVNDGLFKISDNRQWMTKFVWYGGMVSWRHRLTEGRYFQLDMLPGIPEIISIGPGMSFQRVAGR